MQHGLILHAIRYHTSTQLTALGFVGQYKKLQTILTKLHSRDGSPHTELPACARATISAHTDFGPKLVTYCHIPSRTFDLLTQHSYNVDSVWCCRVIHSRTCIV